VSKLKMRFIYELESASARVSDPDGRAPLALGISRWRLIRLPNSTQYSYQGRKRMQRSGPFFREKACPYNLSSADRLCSLLGGGPWIAEGCLPFKSGL
jgi:hypothetical protein